MTDTPLFAQRNLLRVSGGSGDHLVQPAPASCDGADQSEASFRPLPPDPSSRDAMGQQDLPESFGRWLLPGNGQKAVVSRFFDIVC
jgi:hypothetical protein